MSRHWRCFCVSEVLVIHKGSVWLASALLLTVSAYSGPIFSAVALKYQTHYELNLTPGECIFKVHSATQCHGCLTENMVTVKEHHWWQSRRTKVCVFARACQTVWESRKAGAWTMKEDEWWAGSACLPYYRNADVLCWTALTCWWNNIY